MASERACLVSALCIARTTNRSRLKTKTRRSESTAYCSALQYGVGHLFSVWAGVALVPATKLKGAPMSIGFGALVVI